jgi:fido (protein-threonine AMPylation protein)
MMFLIAEVHPFIDGNGRVARLMMNAELVHAGLSRIILPTVFRDDYLLALRVLSRSGNPAPLVRAMDYVQDFTARLPMSSYEVALQSLTLGNAFKEPEEARLSMPRP